MRRNTVNISDEYLELAHLCKTSYEDSPQGKIGNFKLIRIYDDPETGYFGVAYRNKTDGSIAITSRGTEVTDIKDLKADVGIAFSSFSSAFKKISDLMPKSFKWLLPKKNFLEVDINNQIRSGQHLVNQVMSEYPDCDNIVFCGHSLGGAISQVLSAVNKKPFVTFDSPGARIVAENFFNKESFNIEDIDNAEGNSFLNSPNIVNVAGGGHLGKDVYMVKSPVNKSSADLIGLLKSSAKQHPIQHMIEAMEVNERCTAIPSCKWPKGPIQGLKYHLMNNTKDLFKAFDVLHAASKFNPLSLDSWKMAPKILYGDSPFEKAIADATIDFVSLTCNSIYNFASNLFVDSFMKDSGEGFLDGLSFSAMTAA